MSEAISCDRSETTGDLIDAWDPTDGERRWELEGPVADPDPTWRLGERGLPVGPGSGRSVPPSFAFALNIHGSSVADSPLDLGGPTPPLLATTRPVAARSPLVYPQPGAVLAGFRLVTELGRGAFARVYLAEQADLADRLVALKVSRALGAEPQSLARLQHAHIVPIHSVHDDPATGLRLMCMPYLGGANLAQVLETTGAHLPSHTTGASLVDALDQVGARRPSLPGSLRSQSTTTRPVGLSSAPGSRARGAAVTRGLGTPSRVRSRWGRYLARLTAQTQIWPWGLAGLLAASPSRAVLDHAPDADTDTAEQDVQPARQFFRSHTYVQAAVWIAARLAEALEHAHARGILHRDLKPSNVLVAADGTPMLLDFNLSADLSGPGDASRAMLGGTLPYMAPEHLDAFDTQGTTPPEAVDQRSDLYALGLILFEMAAGHHPFADPDPRLPLPEALRKMIAERRSQRPSARASNPAVPYSLDAILKKCLDPDPDRRYQRAGDLANDLRRFLDDLPLAHAPNPSLTERAAKWIRRHPEVRGATMIGTVAAALLIGFGVMTWTMADRFQVASAVLRRKQFESTFRECQILLNTRSGPIGRHLDRGLALADHELAAYGAADPDRFLTASAVRRLAPSEQRALREQISELILLRSRARAIRASRLPETQRRAELVDALRWLDRAERIDPRPSAALFQQRAGLARPLGLADRAHADEQRALAIPPESSRDEYLLGTSLASERRLDAAEVHLERAVALDSRRFWAWFALGLCHYDQGRFAEAAADFTACTLLAPTFPWPYLNRGLALAQDGRLVGARAAYDRALELNPEFAEARVNRALCALEMDDPALALRDLDHALNPSRHQSNSSMRLSRDPAVLAARAEALSRLGRREEAESAFGAALSDRPDDAGLLVARGFFRLGHDPDRADADFLRALNLEPSNARALLGRAHVARPSDPRAALELADRALASAPRFTDALRLRALLRAHLGDSSAVADADALSLVPTALNLYNAACTFAVLARTTRDDRLLSRAHSLLLRALDAGFSNAFAANDPDLEPLRGQPQFRDRWAIPSGP